MDSVQALYWLPRHGCSGWLPWMLSYSWYLQASWLRSKIRDLNFVALSKLKTALSCFRMEEKTSTKSALPLKREKPRKRKNLNKMTTRKLTNQKTPSNKLKKPNPEHWTTKSSEEPWNLNGGMICIEVSKRQNCLWSLFSAFVGKLQHNAKQIH